MTGVLYCWNSVNDVQYPVDVDQHHRAVVMIEAEHRQLHKGNMFDVSSNFDIPAGATAYLRAQVGDEEIHWRDYSIKGTTGPIAITFYEAPTITADGAIITPINRNRNSTNISGVTVDSNPTVTDDGDFLFTNGALSSGGGVNTVTTVESSLFEWVLSPNTSYLFKLENTDSQTSNVYASFFYYESITKFE